MRMAANQAALQILWLRGNCHTEVCADHVLVQVGKI